MTYTAQSSRLKLARTQLATFFMQLPNSSDVRAPFAGPSAPKPSWGKLRSGSATWRGSRILRLILRPGPGTMLGGWASFISFVFSASLLVSGVSLGAAQADVAAAQSPDRYLRFHRRHSHHPAGRDGLLAGFLFAGQFATYVAMSDLQSELHHLEATNRSLATQFRILARAGKLNAAAGGRNCQRLGRELSPSLGQRLGRRKSFMLARAGRGEGPVPIKPSRGIQGRFCRICASTRSPAAARGQALEYGHITI